MGRMKKAETPAKLRDEKLFKLIRNYLLVYLPVQRGASAHTVTGYRTVLSQYLSYAAEKNGIKLNTVTFDMFNRENVDAYLDYLTAEKGFSTATRNNRLAAIRAFVSYASACYPDYMALESELSAIKVQKDDPFSKVDYMTENAVTALLNEPNARTKIGLRDSLCKELQAMCKTLQGVQKPLTNSCRHYNMQASRAQTIAQLNPKPPARSGRRTGRATENRKTN